MKPPARVVVGNVIWGTDGGVWAVWRVTPFPHAHTAPADKLAVHSRLRGLLLGLPANSMLLSVCERIDPMGLVTQMVKGVDLDTRPAWADVCLATGDWLAEAPVYRRRYYVAAELPANRRSWREVLRSAAGEVHGAFGIGPSAVPAAELELRRRQARELKARLGASVQVATATAGEISWLYARSLRREAGEPPFDEAWEPPRPTDEPGIGSAEELDRPRGVLAQLTDAVIKEGGYKGDPDRPRHRRYVRIDGAGGTSYQTVMAMSDMPHFFAFPNGGGEWLYYADHVGFPVDWCVRIKAIPNADAQAKVRRKQRDLIGQVDEYDGEVTGAPPQLAAAIQAMDQERAQLGANPMEPELQVTVLMSVAAGSLADLEDKSAALVSMFEPQEYGLARPTGGQADLLRSMLPGTTVAPVCRDYTQFMLTRDLAAGSPFCGSEVGDPSGLLLGLSFDGGTGTPVLFDPAYGPQANVSPSLAAVGRLGSGKSFFLKRLCWDTVARGGQVVTIDRTRSGEYVRFAETVPGQVQVVRLDSGADVCLDPMRTFAGPERSAVALGFLSLLAGCSPHSDEGAALAEAVDAVAGRRGGSLSDVVDELQRMADDPRGFDQAARLLVRRLGHYRRSVAGQLAFGSGNPVSLEADFIVFWAPNLALPDREMLESEHRSRMMLPEQVLGQALLYLVAAVGRRVVFHDPRRFAAALYDEAWALLASPYGQNLLIEGVRDGRKHNGAIWLASQHPNDFAVSELTDLLGSRFVFRQARQAIPAALDFLGASESADAAQTLEQGLGNGQCLYRDVRERSGLIQIMPPLLPGVVESFETAPASASREDGDGAEPHDALDAMSLMPDPAGIAALDPPRAGVGAAAHREISGGNELAGPSVDDSIDPNVRDPEVVDPEVVVAARAEARRRRRTPLAAALRREDDA